MPKTGLGAVGGDAHRRLVVRVNFGLANRLMGLASAMVLARAFDRKLTLLWSTTDGSCIAPLESVFDLGAFTDIEVIDPRGADDSWVDVRTVAPTLLREWLVGPASVVRFRGCEFFGAETLPPHVFYSAVQDLMRQIRPSAAVRELIGGTVGATIGIHARFTDHLPCCVMTPRWCYRAAALQLNQSVPTTKVLVCSDDPALAHELVSTLGSRGILQPSLRHGDRVERTSVEGVQLAAADLWLLAHSRCVFASPISSFAVSATTLGGGVRSGLFASRHVTRMKSRALLWKASSLLKYDRDVAGWSGRDVGPESIQARAARGTAQAFMRLVTSNIYQDHPRVGQEAHCRARVADFLYTHAHLFTGETEETVDVPPAAI